MGSFGTRTRIKPGFTRVKPRFVGAQRFRRTPTVGIRVDQFFDRAAVMSAMTRAERRALSRAGAHIMTDSRRSLQMRKKSSTAPAPPSRHAPTNQSLRYIHFDYDAQLHGVRVGPSKFQAVGREVPNVTETGGQGIAAQYNRGTGKVTMRMAMYQARPFMGPALKREAPKLPGYLKSEVPG